MRENAVIIIFVILIVTGRFIVMIFRQPQKMPLGKIFNDKTISAALIIPVICFSAPIVEYFLINKKINHKITVFGSLIIILGFIVILFSNKAIGSNWSASIQKEGTEKLITSGVYKFIRHPLYFSGLLIFIGIFIYFQSWLSSILLIPSFLFINLRIKHEEKELLGLFTEDFLQYKKLTKKIIPFIY